MSAPVRIPWLAPTAVLQRVAEMRDAGGGRAADALLDAIGARRTPAEVAGVVAAGTTGDASRVLAAAARRPAAEVAELLDLLDAPGADRLAGHLAAGPAAVVLDVMLELISADRRALSRTVAAACAGVLARPVELPERVSAATRARLVIDLVVALPEPHGFLERAGEVAPELLAEPPGIVTAVLTRAVAAGAGRQAQAIVDELAGRPQEAVRWVARLTHVAPEPGGTGGRRPDLVDRYLRAFAGRHPSDLVAWLVGELDRNGLTWVAQRLVREIRLDVQSHARRFEIARALHETPRTVTLWNAWSAEPVEAARAAAIDELYRRLGDGVLPGAVAGDPHADWLEHLTIEDGEWPLWLMQLPGAVSETVVAGFSTWGLHVRCGLLAGAEPYRIEYARLAELTFRPADTHVELRRQLPGTPAQLFAWPVSGRELGHEPVHELVALLNQAADAARRGLAMLSAVPPGPAAPSVPPAAPVRSRPAPAPAHRWPPRTPPGA